MQKSSHQPDSIANLMDIVCKKDGGGELQQPPQANGNGYHCNGITSFAFEEDNTNGVSSIVPSEICDEKELYNGEENGGGESSPRRNNELPDSNRTNYIQTLMHLLNGFIGSGILSMPMAFRDGGIVLASVLNPIIGIMSLYCIHMLLSINRFSMKRTNTKMPYDYHEVSAKCRTGIMRFRKSCK